MDDGRLDQLEQALLLHARSRKPLAPPAGLTEGVMREVRALADRRSDFWSVFVFAARRFVPAGALAATTAGGYALLSERVLNQALLTLSLHGGDSPYLLAGLLP
jgi:hypothetical protein